jgi:hypothetical protein
MQDKPCHNRISPSAVCAALVQMRGWRAMMKRCNGSSMLATASANGLLVYESAR